MKAAWVGSAMAALLPLAAGETAAQAAREADRPRFRDSVTVERAVTELRVVDSSGVAIRGLGPRDFRVEVFSLDITHADYHTLEVGLEQVAPDTGGFYEKTHEFPDQALRRVSQALAGYYLLTLEVPPRGERDRGPRSLEVRLAARRGRVLARATIEE